MGVTTALIGFLPGYAQVGYAAPALLVVLRLLQGMGAGAEYAGAAVVSYEHAREGRRGSQGAWPALGLNIGLVLSSLVIFLLSLNGDQFLIDGGWRIPFILSLVLVVIGLWVRRAMPESPEFERVVQAESKSRFRDVFRDHWKGLLVVLVVAIGYNAVSYIFKTFSVAYLSEFQGVKAAVSSSAVLVAGIVAVITVPIFGKLCDLFGSKRVILWGGVASAVFAFPFLGLLESAAAWGAYVAIGVGTGILAPAMFSAQGAFLSRQFSTDARSTGVGTAREIGTAVAGGLAPLGALSLVVASPTHSTVGVAIVIAASGLVVAAAALFDQGRRFGSAKN
jgi:MFS family permease